MADQDDDDIDSSSFSGEEEPMETTPSLCLFCSKEFSEGSTAVLEHCSVEHGFQLFEFIHSKGLEFYSCIKLINYIRKVHPEPAAILAASAPYPWSPDCYLTPVLEDDPLLQLDFDPSEELHMDESNEEEADLRKRLANAEKTAIEYKDTLAQTLAEFKDMRLAVQHLVTEETETKEDHTHCEIAEGKLPEEDGYFGSYTHYKIHEEMLKDEVRTETYKYFIEKNSSFFKDKVVLDVGCGTGILSLFAASAGAKKVIGIDQSNIVYKAMDIIRENGYEDKVCLIKGKVEETTLPVDKVDIIISEWMGYFLLYESMLDTVLYARDKWLSNPSHVFPSTCSISLVAMGNLFEWESRVSYWESVYGFKMSCIREDVLREPNVQVVDHHSTISSTDTIKKFDLRGIRKEELNFEAPFSLTMQHDTKCHALVGYFDVSFDDVDHPTYLSTSPQDLPTHWKQTVFYLRKPIPVHTGDLLKGKLKCCKRKKDPRSLDIFIELELSSYFSESQRIKVEQTFVME